MADTKISDLDGVTDLQDTDEFVLARSGATKKIDGVDLRSELGGGLFDAYAYLREEQTSGTAAGTFTQGAWQTRVLNTEVSDTAGIVTLSSNQFTLQAGSYVIRARAPGFHVDFHKAKLRNVTDSADTLIGSNAISASSGDNTATDSWVTGRFTIAGTKTFELQHQCTTTLTTNGFGASCTLSVAEVYSEIEIWREA